MQLCFHRLLGLRLGPRCRQCFYNLAFDHTRPLWLFGEIGFIPNYIKIISCGMFAGSQNVKVRRNQVHIKGHTHIKYVNTKYNMTSTHIPSMHIAYTKYTDIYLVHIPQSTRSISRRVPSTILYIKYTYTHVLMCVYMNAVMLLDSASNILTAYIGLHSLHIGLRTMLLINIGIQCESLKYSTKILKCLSYYLNKSYISVCATAHVRLRVCTCLCACLYVIVCVRGG